MTLEAPPMSKWRWLLYGAGSAMIAFGVWGQLFGADTNPKRYGELLLVAALGHDLVLAPVFLVLGLLARRFLHHHVRGPLQGAALVGFVLLLVALPGMGRYGARSDNGSLLPRDYTTGFMLSMGVLGLATLLYVGFRQVRRRP